MHTDRNSDSSIVNEFHANGKVIKSHSHKYTYVINGFFFLSLFYTKITMQSSQFNFNQRTIHASASFKIFFLTKQNTLKLEIRLISPKHIEFYCSELKACRSDGRCFSFFLSVHLFWIENSTKGKPNKAFQYFTHQLLFGILTLNNPIKKEQNIEWGLLHNIPHGKHN